MHLGRPDGGGDRRAEIGLRQGVGAANDGKPRDFRLAWGVLFPVAGGGGGGGTAGAWRCHRGMWEQLANRG